MNKIPEISIITACFNHGRYINDMLESVFNQTFQDYEVIIVNDGSTDDTAQILQEIIHDKVLVIHTENRGPAAARNLAIKNARAPLILNLDADDKIAPEYLVKAYHIFQNNPNIGIVSGDAELFGARSGKFVIGEYTLKDMLLGNRINSQSFFRKIDWTEVGGYSDDLVHGLEDWDFWLRLIELGREPYKINENLIFYRVYKNLALSRSGRRKLDRSKILESVVIIYRRHKKLISTFPDVEEKYLRIERRFKHENFIIKSIKNFLNRYYQKYFWP